MNSIKNATDKIYSMIEELKKAVNLIDKTMVEEWVTDLVLAKTYIGLNYQYSILKNVSEILKQDLRDSSIEEVVISL